MLATRRATLLLIPLLLAAPALAQEGATAFVNVSVIPMDRERVLPAHTVVVANGAITAMGPSTRVAVPRGATVIDGRGKFLIPGLADVHVHVTGDRTYDLPLLKLFVANGVTTVLVMRGAPDRLTLRADVAAGRVLGPRIYTVGPYVNEPFVTTPEEVDSTVVDQKRAGYDFIKMHGDLTPAAYARLMAASRRERIRVVGHSPRNLGIDPMYAERQYAVAHAEEFIYNRDHTSRDASAVAAEVPGHARKMAAARIWLMPNLTAYKSIAYQLVALDSLMKRPEMRFMPAPIRDGWGPERNPYVRRIRASRHQPMLASYRVLESITRQFHAAGVRLLVGTDALNVGVVPGFSAHEELQDLVTAGLTPFGALRAATANAGEFFGDRRMGTIAVGKHADLVLLDRNPLVEISGTRSIAGVMLRGRWMGQREIESLLRSATGDGN